MVELDADRLAGASELSTALWRHRRRAAQGWKDAACATSRFSGVLTSMMGLEARTFSSMLASLAEPLTVAKYLMAYLADTVFPAPDSPLTMMDWFLSSLGGQEIDKSRDWWQRRAVTGYFAQVSNWWHEANRSFELNISYWSNLQQNSLGTKKKIYHRIIISKTCLKIMCCLYSVHQLFQTDPGLRTGISHWVILGPGCTEMINNLLHFYFFVFFCGGERPSDLHENENCIQKWKPGVQIKILIVSKGNFHITSPLRIICSSRLSKEAMKLWKLRRQLDTKQPEIKRGAHRYHIGEPWFTGATQRPAHRGSQRADARLLQRLPADYYRELQSETVRPPADYFWLWDWPTNPEDRKREGLSHRENTQVSRTHTHTHQPGHLFVSLLCHSKDVRVHVTHVLAAVGVDDVGTVDGKRLIRVDGHQDDSCTSSIKQQRVK